MAAALGLVLLLRLRGPPPSCTTGRLVGEHRARVTDQEPGSGQAKMEDTLKRDYREKVTDQERDDSKAKKEDQMKSD